MLVRVCAKRVCANIVARSLSFALIAAAVWGLCAAEAAAQGRRLSIGEKGLDYYGPETDNPFATLMDKVERGELKLPYHETQGYLPALLRELDLAPESQLLLFSKSSLQSGHIGPTTPRALYFNDDITLGWIPNAPIIELMAQDPVKGTMFYSIPQEPDIFQPRRDTRCNGCHATSRSAYVPGYLLRSFETNQRGGLVSGLAKITQETPVASRWGGWYISGETPQQPHRGNLRGPEDFARHRDEPLHRGALKDLSELVDLSAYPVATSDVAAAMVMDHFADTINLLVRAGTEHRLGEEVTVIDRLAIALLTLDEAPLQGPVKGTGGYVEQYKARGPFDAKGRTLRELDLQTRLFRWGVSPLVYSATFQNLPEPVKAELQQKMTAYLDGSIELPESATLSAEDRAVALSILRETLPDWPR